MNRLLPSSVLLLACALLGACSPTFSRGRDDPSIDEAALSTKLDAADLDHALDSWYSDFLQNKKVAALPDDQRTIAVLQINNNTSEYIAPQLDALIESFETKLVNDGEFRVITRDQLASNALLNERMRSTSDQVDPETTVTLGKEFGVRYIVTGRVQDNTEKTSGKKRVQYFLFLQVTSVETSEVIYKNKVQITKQVEG
ncbi:MAG: hypothetical protein H6825_01385 [Planctomycetes bacterium]|nr:hypothetical protein [Planctomycetota bacterium]